MPIDPAAFRHHPELIGRIKEPEDSFFRDLDVEEMSRMVVANGGPANWRYPDEMREELRRTALAGRQGDVWVFAYGSLMWDPGIFFHEVRRARLPGWSRQLCLVDRFGGRGTPEAPGLMAGLVPGGHCDGLAFRIAASEVEEETEQLFRREMLAPCYLPTFTPAETAEGEVEVLAFVADDSTEMIETGLPRQTQIRYIASGRGTLGTSLEYLAGVVDHFRAFGIHDDELEGLLTEVRTLTA
ncbi:gamma-glutamylcyclotransferase [Pseudoroseicyclus tamaricis]|uniref:glutathione-specific gamma-glutamylcyclotransferase n=1 Tax=Pseudoroseicyclus tamaricis TaxID=2705421 RepID=A0A6B2JVX2_9RHOB|nr:gamma-glutamylcyclotransferase [Pseudoroseicyclus tamaricis]NDV02260.1 gamma-glutamylcyclotransferase [Pseudoroseicyclus tamaricis]